MNKESNGDSSLFNQMLSELEKATRSWWDITVILYTYLVKGLEFISVREAEFIRDYGDKEYSDKYIYTDAYKTFVKILSVSEDRYEISPSQMTEVIQEFKKIRAILGKDYNHLTVLSSIYSFLLCLDSYAGDWLDKIWDEKEVGPLNCNTELGFALYLRGNRMLTSAAKDCGFYDQNLQISFRAALPHLIFWQIRTNLRGVVIPLPSAPFFKGAINQKAQDGSLDISLRIAVLPLDCALSGSTEKSVQPYLKLHNRTNSSIYWEYAPDGQDRITAKLMKDLEAALKWNPHIIMFPEYSIGKEQLRKIEEYVLENKKTLIKKNLKFIIAGTTWETVEKEDGSFEYDNICHVIALTNTWKSYKAEEYCEYVGEAKNRDGSSLFTRVETLTHPAKELTTPYLQNIGYVQIPICRDVINSEGQQSIAGIVADRLSPTLILVPAWSPSHDRFIKPLDRFVGLYYSCVVLCNSCTAALGTRIGLAGVPQRYQAIHDMYMKHIPSECGVCRENCTSRDESCVFLANITNRANHTRDSIDFSFSRV